LEHVKEQLIVCSIDKTMAENITISNKPPLSLASDYTKLREQGIGYIEQFAHELWTDYNKHDPGITTLEMLCYAITDLSLRTQLPMQDLLASSWGDATKMRDSFVTADLVLPICPVTELDYRKLFIDIDGVRNAWLSKAKQKIFVNCTKSTLNHKEDTPHKLNEKWLDKPFELNGLYDITIDFDGFFINEQIKAGSTEGGVKQQILDKVKTKYLNNRHLCEDIAAVQKVPVQKIMICADVDIANDAVVSEVYAQILFEVQNYLDPPIKRYSLAEMRTKADEDGILWTIDQIFEGPLLNNGFIVDEELEAAQLREVLYTSDIINLIMGIKGVLAVKKVRLNTLIEEITKPSCGDWKTLDTEGKKWCLHIEKGYQPQLCMEKVALAFYKDIIPVGSLNDKTKALRRVEDLQKAAYESNKKSIEAVPVPTGDVFDITDYSSVINEFPQNYGIGRYGLPNSASMERKAKAKQFKGYLLFFDQILTNYLAQLKNVKTLFAAQTDSATYFGQPLTDVVDMNAFYPPSVLGTLQDHITDVLKQQEGFEDNPVRKNRFLDHLLARFAENFSDYAMLMFSLFGERSNEEILQDKVAFLKDFYECPLRLVAETEAAWQQRCRVHFHQVCRARAYNYCKPAWETDNVAGVTRRLARLMGMRNHQAYAASAIQLVHTRNVGGGGSPDKFQYEVQLPDGTVLLESKNTFPDADKAFTAGMQDLILSVPFREQMDIKKIATKWVFILNDKNTHLEIARSPAPRFNTEAEARLAANALLEHLIYDGESLFMVENILLRPDEGNTDEKWMPVCTEPNCEHCKPLDPYSYRVSVILPGYTARFRDINYRRYLERLIREELPAHVLARICWIGREQLAEFEGFYKTWLVEKNQTCAVKNPINYAKALNDLIDILDKLYTIYPTGVLHDCETADENSPIILGQSALGTLKT
jgi:uncharacterized protein